jgi:hypothetical protein
MADVISHIKAIPFLVDLVYHIYKLYNKTDMYFLADEYDVICTEKLKLTSAIASVNINFFSTYHIIFNS